MLSYVKQRMWAILGSIDKCGLGFLEKLCLKGVNVRLLIPEYVGWEVLRELPRCAMVRLYSSLSYERAFFILDDRVYRGALNLTCSALTGVLEEFKAMRVDDAIREFESLWSKASPSWERYVELGRFNLGSWYSFIKWYLEVVLEPPLSHIKNVFKEYIFNLKVNLIRFMRGDWYPFNLLEPEVQELLRGRFEKPTPIQMLAIPRVLRGENLLVVAPTGSGKTESVILPVLSLLVRERKERSRLAGVKVLYIAPMKALADNMTRRLERYAKELFGILPGPVRQWHSDVSDDVKQGICRSPPLILIITPESLESLLDLRSDCWRILRNVKYVIVDEVHELIYSKRGEQLLVLLERIKKMHGIERIQRLFLSATVANKHEIARLIGGSDGPVSVVEDPRVRRLEVKLQISTDADRDLAQVLSDGLGGSRGYIVFTNTRGLTEHLKHLLSESGINDIGVYHSSLSRDLRKQLEEEFNKGILRGLVATRALELGVDLDNVKNVALVSSPRLPEHLLQRFGRSSHRPGESSSGLAVATGVDDLLEFLALIHLVDRGRLVGARVNIPSLDVVSREIVAEVLRAGSVEFNHLIDIMVNAFPSEVERLRGDIERLVNHLVDRNVLSRANGNLVLGGGFYDVWRRMNDFVSFIPGRVEARVVDINTSRRVEIGTIDAINLAFLRIGHVIRLAGNVWRVKQIKGLKVLVKKVEEERFAIPVWKSGGVRTPQLVAIEAYRLLGKLDRIMDSVRLKREVKLRSVSLEVDESSAKVLEDLVARRDQQLPSPRLMIVDMITAGAFGKIPSKLKENVKSSYDVIATVALYPFGGLIANTIASALKVSESKRVHYIIPEPLGLLIVHQPDFNFVEWMLKLDKQMLEDTASKSPYLKVVAREIARSLGYKVIPKNIKEEKILYEEALRQTLNRFYDVEGTLRLADWLRAGCVKVLERRVVEPEGVHKLTKALFNHILKLNIQ